MSKRITLTDKYLHPHHLYQLAIFLLFAAGLFLLFPFYMITKSFGVDQTAWQWYYIIPWMGIYMTYCLYLRNQITKAERVPPQKRHLLYWILLGHVIVAIHMQPLDLDRLYGLNIAFCIFSLFVADSYWDFQNIPFRPKKEIVN